MTLIKTPDQRVRVFISSTINELADERKAVREAVSNLRLTPVFFEAGARPHPPRDLYSAYLEQSHIFLGIYWNSYGWVAPGAEISGLEDEYRLCGKKPKLIYVKKSDSREERLKDLLHDIERSDSACYQKFTDADELRTLIENDLSVLMSEIFENALFTQQSPAAVPIEIHSLRKVELPNMRSTMIGREADVNALMEMIKNPEVHLVNILGAGGTGKTTISIHLAHAVQGLFDDGAVFVPLAPVTDSNLVASTIANVLGLQDTGKQPIRQTLVENLVDKNMLLVLDNFEQIVEAADVVTDMLNQCPQVKVVATSRRSLNIRGEHIYNLQPLSLPGDSAVAKNDVTEFPSIKLFIERAREVNANLLLNDENKKAIIEICERLDGLPLAIELAAARTKFFQPAQLLQRMSKTLDLVSKGQKDLPERQQTLRNAIAWSYNLLDEDAKKAFRFLGTFKRSWTMEAADAVINSEGALLDVEDMMEQLLNVSLIKPVLVSHSSEPRFNMLQTVHEYANEMLDASPDVHTARLAYANYFLQLLESSEDQLWGVNSEPWFDKMEYEYQNIRASFYFFCENKLYESAWKFFYLTFLYWQARGGMGEVGAWLKAARIHVEEEKNDPALQAIDANVRGKAYLWAAYCELFLVWIQEGFVHLNRAEELLAECGDENNLAIALVMDGGYGMYVENPDYEEKLARAEALVVKTGNVIAKGFLYSWAVEYYRQRGDMDTMEKRLNEAEKMVDENELPVIRFFIGILRMMEVFHNERFEEYAQLCLDYYYKFPVKSYKSMRGAMMGGYAYCLMKMNRMEESRKPMLVACELIRESGDKEGLYHSLQSLVPYFSKCGRQENSIRIWGCVNAFVEAANYPLVAHMLLEYEDSKAHAQYDENNAAHKQLYDEGKKISLEEMMVRMMKEMEKETVQ
ncbi:MAG: DUF4062 domain-containing protein [Flavobacteriales bacterium]